MDSQTAEEGRGTHRSLYEGTCANGHAHGRAVLEILDRISDKWLLLVIATLQDGPLRFTELQRHIAGVSQRMLTRTLRHLERDGLVSRTAYAEVPPRVEYALTDEGTTLIAPAHALAEWVIAHYPAIERSRAEFDANAR